MRSKGGLGGIKAKVKSRLCQPTVCAEDLSEAQASVKDGSPKSVAVKGFTTGKYRNRKGRGEAQRKRKEISKMKHYLPSPSRPSRLPGYKKEINKCWKSKKKHKQHK